MLFGILTYFLFLSKIKYFFLYNIIFYFFNHFVVFFWGNKDKYLSIFLKTCYAQQFWTSPKKPPKHRSLSLACLQFPLYIFTFLRYYYGHFSEDVKSQEVTNDQMLSFVLEEALELSGIRVAKYLCLYNKNICICSGATTKI